MDEGSVRRDLAFEAGCRGFGGREQFRKVVGEPFSSPFEEGLLTGPERVEGHFGTR